MKPTMDTKQESEIAVDPAAACSRVARNRERIARLYSARIEAGLCPRCGDANDGDRYYCGACNAAHNEHKRCKRLIRFRNCFCGAKATETSGGTFYCPQHWSAEQDRMKKPKVWYEAHKQKLNAKRAWKRENGICRICNEKAVPSYTHCEKHLETNRQAQRLRR